MKIVLLLALLCSLSVQAKLPDVKPGEPLPSDLFVELAKLINPAVVNISTTQLPKRGSRMYQDPYQQFLEEFFGPQFKEMQRRPAQSLGTGFIIRGWIDHHKQPCD
ncbi:MAG: hypothetical protein R2827_06815 [Bdellovibrionales bacterium]